MWIVRRVCAVIATLWLAITLVFFLLRLLPGNAIQTQLTESGASQAIIAQREAALNLNAPVLEQYTAYWGALLQGNLGVSLISGQPVSAIIAAQAPPTIALAMTALIVAGVLGIILGCIAGLGENAISKLDRALLLVLMSTPAYWIGTLILFGALVFMPASVVPRDSVLLPTIALGLSITGAVGRIVQQKVSEIRRQDFVLQARAKGITEFQITTRHILRVGLLSLTTVIALQFGFLAGGVVIIEMIFARPGLGRTLLDATLRQDYPVTQGIVAYSAVLVSIAMIISELIAYWLDPRVRHQ